MEREPVVSSNLRSIGYDAAQRILEIEFRHGGIYQYSGITSTTYQGLMQATSHGAYFNRYIRDKYPTSRIR